MQTVPKELAPPSRRRPAASGRIGPYELLEEIARGGMGIVYAARDAQGRMVALKVMRDTANLAAALAGRFRREAEAAAQICHPHIVQIHELGEHEDRLYLVMDFVSGGTLADHVKRFLADCRFTVRTMVKVAQAVHYAHQCGIVHRDLKPSNVLLNELDEPKVTDFGLAKFPDGASDLSRDGELIGTPAYMSPEQAGARNDAIGAATDVWGLGVILYELLTGLKPFPGGEQGRVLYAIQNAEPLSPCSVRPLLDPVLARMVLQCLAKDPADRYPSAAALADDLDRWLRGETAKVVRFPHRPSRRFGYLIRLGSLILAFALLIGVCWILVGQEAPGRQQAADAITDQLRGGAKVELLRDGDMPSWHHWPLSPSQQIGLRPFSLESYAPCPLQLVPEALWTGYSLRVESRAHNFGLGDAGLYFGHQEQDVAGVSDHFFCALLYARTDHVKRLSLCAYRIREQRSETSGVFHTAVLYQLPLDEAPIGVPGWHELGVDVAGEECLIHWDGRQRGAVAWDAVRQAFGHLAAMEPKVPTPAVQAAAGGAGVYVKNGSAAFQNFTVQPIQ